jgi:hypothetical protein
VATLPTFLSAVRGRFTAFFTVFLTADLVRAELALLAVRLLADPLLDFFAPLFTAFFDLFFVAICYDSPS